MPITVFIVDDHPVIREGLKRLFERQPNIEVVGEASDGQQATELVARYSPDIVVLDISMPGIDGVQTTRLIRNLSPESKVIALTVHDEPRYLREVFEAGASGYVLKRSSPDELMHAIRSVVGRGIYVD